MYLSNSARSFTSATDWDEAFTSLHGASLISVDDQVPWAGRLDWRQSPTYNLAYCAGGGERVSRQSRHIRADPRGTCELLVPLGGKAWVEQGSSSSEIRPGHMALCDIDNPFTFAHDDNYRSIALIVPRHNVAMRSPRVARESQLIDSGNGLGRVIRMIVTTMQEERDELSASTFDVTCDRLLDLVCLAAEGDTSSAPMAHREVVEADIRRYIRQHAHESDLDVTVIAKALGWSARYIQQVLQATGTTSRDLIRHERLHLARAQLAGSGTSSIGQVARGCGFSSQSAFATAFRKEFGMTPSDARKLRETTVADRTG